MAERATFAVPLGATILCLAISWLVLPVSKAHRTPDGQVDIPGRWFDGFELLPTVLNGEPDYTGTWEFELCWPILIAEQAALLLLGGGVLTWLVRRKRRRASSS